MALKPTGVIRQLGWRGFFQLLTHLPSFAKLFSRLIKDPRVPASPKLIVAGILAYVILPTDLLPDFLIGVGQLDDLAVILGGLKLFLRFCPKEVVREHLQAISDGRRFRGK
ncbi:MAG: YkvA family protein [Candidatus Binatia bacterium]